VIALFSEGSYLGMIKSQVWAKDSRNHATILSIMPSSLVLVGKIYANSLRIYHIDFDLLTFKLNPIHCNTNQDFTLEKEAIKVFLRGSTFNQQYSNMKATLDAKIKQTKCSRKRKKPIGLQ
jgi:hypothetical protein